jgi:hypothetical protein
MAGPAGTRAAREAQPDGWPSRGASGSVGPARGGSVGPAGLLLGRGETLAQDHAGEGIDQPSWERSNLSQPDNAVLAQFHYILAWAWLIRPGSEYSSPGCCFLAFNILAYIT